MALPLIVDDVSTLPEPVRGEYAKGEDGKYRLAVEGLPDVTNLEKALKSEREANKGIKSKIAGWEKLGKSPEEIESMLAEERRKAEEAELKAGKFDEVLGRHKTEWQKERDEVVGAATKERDSALNVARDALRNTHVNAALVKAKATAEGLALLPEILGKRVQIEFDAGNPKVSILGTDGTPMVGSGKDGLATYEDLVKEAVKSFPSLFEGNGGGTGAPSKGGGAAGAKTIKRADFDALDPAARGAKIKEGFTVVD